MGYGQWKCYMSRLKLIRMLRGQGGLAEDHQNALMAIRDKLRTTRLAVVATDEA